MKILILTNNTGRLRNKSNFIVNDYFISWSIFFCEPFLTINSVTILSYNLNRCSMFNYSAKCRNKKIGIFKIIDLFSRS